MATRQPPRKRTSASRNRNAPRANRAARGSTSPAGRSGRVADHIVETSVRAEFRPAIARGAAAAAVVRLDEHRGAVAEVELESGARFYTTIEQFAADFMPPAAREAVAPGQFVVPAVLAAPGAESGIGQWAIKALRLLDIDPVEGGAKLTATAVCDWYERKQLYREAPDDEAEQRLWRVGDGNAFSLERVDAAKPGDPPLLVFLHGTASSTRGSFGELWAPQASAVRTNILGPYRGNAYAFEHRSLTQSPIENAIDLVDRLPRDARLHLVSHSRGGLIGELLCRGQMTGGAPFDDDRIDSLFADSKHSGEAKQLRNLARKLEDKKLRIERFVRVACPAAGTILASERLDRCLSLTLDAIGTIGDLATSGYYAVFEEFVKAFVRTRTDASALPGLEAQMPNSPIVRLLNDQRERSTSDLHVVAGDIEGGDLWRRLGILLTDLYYREDHDLIVNTQAMYGGTPRVGVPRRFFAQGPNVYHFTYFRNPETAAKIADGLHKPLDADGFSPFDSRIAPAARGYRAPAPSARAAGAAARPIVFVLPGIMGSCLDGGGKRVWVDLAAINAGDMERLAINADDVTATALMPDSYAALLSFLEATHEVVPFPFDWRLSLRDEAKRLAKELQTWLDEADRRAQSISLIAHSLGGLLARVMIADFPDVWSRIVAKPQGRLVMLGTPNGGSHSIPLMLIGREPIVQGLALVDFKHTQRKLIELIGRFPGVLELLPAQASNDFFDADLWRRLALVDDRGRVFWTPPDATALAKARAIRSVLDRSTPRLDRVLYVAGHAPRTPWQLHLDRPPGLPHESEGSATPPDNFYFESTDEGDGRVPWSTGVLPGVRPWYMDAVHGDLAATPGHFHALLDLITTGTTDKLPTTPPVTATRGPTTEAFRAERAPYVPDAQALEAAALGRARRKKVVAAAVAPVDVVVAHGNIKFVNDPIFVGHYKGDSINSAEAKIDEQLGGRLTAHHRLGLYPGALGTSEVFDNAPASPGTGSNFCGAVVVGLGEVGALTPSQLTATFAHAAIAYATQRLEAVPGAVAAGRSLTVRLSTLLIGSGWKMMAPRDSVIAILRAVTHANDELLRSPYADQVRIGAVTFVELYEDVALQAARALQNAKADVDLAARINVVPVMQTMDGGRTRAFFAEQGRWWHRLQIVAQDDRSLRFTLLTDRARAESTLQPTQRALIDTFVERQIATTTSDDALAVTLFELLVPNRLKEHAPEGRDLVLVLDAAAACYPWELMQDGGAVREAAGERPDAFQLRLALRAGLIRQLQTDTFREGVTNATGRRALVVGDPENDPAIFPELLGAQHEAASVANALSQQGYDVTRLFRPRPDAHSIVQALFARPYRILHLAGHGVFDYEVPLTAVEARRAKSGEPVEPRRVSGMVLGRGAFLTAAEVAQMRAVPELVFVNCCHLGRTSGDVPEARGDATLSRDRHRLAANLATELIRIGVKVVVAAGWAVDDGAAELFAKTFYENMLGGTAFGDAVLSARREVACKYPQSNTWGAYQCYGDYEFRLTNVDLPSRKPTVPEFAGPSELAIELENIASDALTAVGAEIQSLKERVDALAEFVKLKRAQWADDATVCSAFAHALGELDHFDDAVAYYREAMAAERASFTVTAVEQYANLLTRSAIVEWMTSSKDTRAHRHALERIDEAVDIIDRLLSTGRTSERLSIRGAANKRRAMLATSDAERTAALHAMSRDYRDAYELAAQRRRGIASYPLLNWLSAEACLHPDRVDAALRREADDILVALARQLEQGSDTDFWTLVTRADMELVKGLLQGKLSADDRRQLVQQYQAVRARAGSPRQMRSVVEHLEFLGSMYARFRRGAIGAIASELAAALAEMQPTPLAGTSAGASGSPPARRARGTRKRTSGSRKRRVA